MLKMVDGTGIIGVDMICPLGVSAPQPPNYDRVELEGAGMLVLPNSLDAPLERLELGGKTEQVQTSGKNLVNANVYEQGYLTSVNAGDKVSLTQMQKSFTTNMEVSSMQGKNVSVSVRTKEKTGKKYVFTDETDTIITGVFDTGSNNYSEFKNITIPKNAKKLFFSVTYDVQENTELQVELGAKVTTYEPYTGGKPSPSPEYPQEIKSAGKWNEGTQKYEFDMKVTGKNLFDREKARDINNWTDSIVQPGYIDFSIYVGKGNSVNISYSENLEAGLGFYAGIAQSVNNGPLYWLYRSLQQSLNKNNYKLIAECDYISVRVIKSNLQGFLEHIKTLQIENSNTPTSYEPYTEQSVQITLDEPLRGIGEYKDTITKDGAVRKIAPYEVNLNDLRDGGYSKTNTVMFSVKVQNKTVGYASSKPSILCNILPDCALQMSNIYNNDKECIAVGGGIVLFRVNKSRLKDISSFEATKQSFIELMADKKMIVEYALETPVTEPLPESVQQQLQALHSENGTTHVFVDSGEVPCGIKLTYRKEK